MSHQYYHICRSNIGKAVEIRMIDGRICRGIISRVSNSHVYLSPLARSISGSGKQEKGTNAVKTAVKTDQKEYGTPILGYGGYGGFGIGLALGAIAALAFLPFFFW